MGISELIQREWVYLWYYFTLQLRQIVPCYALEIVLGSVISVFVKERIHSLFRSLGDKKTGMPGVIPASMERQKEFKEWKVHRAKKTYKKGSV